MLVEVGVSSVRCFEKILCNTLDGILFIQFIFKKDTLLISTEKQFTQISYKKRNSR